MIFGKENALENVVCPMLAILSPPQYVDIPSASLLRWCGILQTWLVNSFIRLTHLPLVPQSVNWVSIGSGNGLSPVQRQAITWTNAGLLSIGPLGTNFSEIWIKTQKFSFMKMHLNLSSAKWRPFCPGGDEFTIHTLRPEWVWAGLWGCLGRHHQHRRIFFFFVNNILGSLWYNCI